MATTNYGWAVPTVNGSADTWGSTLNTTIEAIDGQLKTVQTTAEASLTSAAIGVTVQAWDAQLDLWAAVTPASYLTTAAAAAAYQPFDSDLTTWAGKTAPSGTVVGTSDTQTLTNKNFRIPISAETSGTLTSASANTTVPCSGGITLDDGVFTAGDYILFDPGSSNRTFTRASGLTMYVNGVDSASATLSANQQGSAHWRSASVVVLNGAFS